MDRERPVLSIAQIYALADAVGPAHRTLVLLASFASLRWAELHLEALPKAETPRPNDKP